MDKLLYDKIRKIRPYIPGEQPEGENIIKLNTNESPYPPSPKIKNILNKFDIENLKLYPSFACSDLKKELADFYSLNTDQIFLGNGSDEVLALCFMAFFNSDIPILFPDITYSFYDVWCGLYNIKYKKIPLDNNFNINKNDYFIPNGGIIIANPNAPTGIYLDIKYIEEILKNNKESIVIIDEAYIDFGGESAFSIIDKYDNLAVVRTFSKSRALAGARVGFAAGNPELIQILESIKNAFNSYTLNTVSQLIAIESIKDFQYFDYCRKKIIDTREMTVNELKNLGFKILPSMTNFIFVSNSNLDIKNLFEFLKSKLIFVRYFDKPRINNYLRITIGTDSDMIKLINSIKEYMK